MLARLIVAVLVLVAVTASAAELSVTKIRLRQNSSGQVDNSVLRMQGFFVLTRRPTSSTPRTA